MHFIDGFKKGKSELIKDDYMIRDVWVVEKAGGRCLFHNSYGKLELDADLLSSFLTGVNSFSEAELGDTGIESIEMGNMKWVYKNWEGKVLFIAAADKSDETPALHHQIDVIRINFLKQFNIEQDKDYFKKWNGNVTQFNKFKNSLDELIRDWKAEDKVSEIAKKMNLLEAFQQILLAFSKVLPSIKPDGVAELEKKMQRVKNSLPAYFQNISYGHNGWDILGVNIADDNCKEEALHAELEFLTRLFVSEMKNIFQEQYFIQIVKKFVFPKLLSDWVRIRELEIDAFLLKIFLG